MKSSIDISGITARITELKAETDRLERARDLIMGEEFIAKGAAAPGKGAPPANDNKTAPKFEDATILGRLAAKGPQTTKQITDWLHEADPSIHHLGVLASLNRLVKAGKAAHARKKFSFVK
jgi:hypothetical protein